MNSCIFVPRKIIMLETSLFWPTYKSYSAEANQFLHEHAQRSKGRICAGTGLHSHKLCIEMINTQSVLVAVLRMGDTPEAEEVRHAS
jgi:hypothetical protein